jgi:hypothetical protein
MRFAPPLAAAIADSKESTQISRSMIGVCFSTPEYLFHVQLHRVQMAAPEYS